MDKQEFEVRIGREISHEDYAVVEKVYAFHPAISETKGKDEIAAIYKLPCGMRIIRDMVPTAEAVAKLEDEASALRNQKTEIEYRLQEIAEKRAAFRK